MWDIDDTLPFSCDCSAGPVTPTLLLLMVSLRPPDKHSQMNVYPSACTSQGPLKDKEGLRISLTFLL